MAVWLECLLAQGALKTLGDSRRQFAQRAYAAGDTHHNVRSLSQRSFSPHSHIVLFLVVSLLDSK